MQKQNWYQSRAEMQEIIKKQSLIIAFSRHDHKQAKAPNTHGEIGQKPQPNHPGLGIEI